MSNGEVITRQKIGSFRGSVDDFKRLSAGAKISFVAMPGDEQAAFDISGTRGLIVNIEVYEDDVQVSEYKPEESVLNELTEGSPDE